MTEPIKAFAERLTPLNRILDLSADGWAVWCCAPIYGPDGKVHVFFTRTPKNIHTWMTQGEIAHATADRPEGPYTVHGTVIKGRGPGYWDRDGLINPRIYKVDDRYALFYMSVGDVSLPEHDRDHGSGIGLCLSSDLWHWTYANGGERVLSPSDDPDAWDHGRCDNPSFVKHPTTGEYWLYYSGGRHQYSPSEPRGIRDSTGLAHSKTLEGPYVRMFNHPVIDSTPMLSRAGRKGLELRGFEDPHVWIENGRYCMLNHDMVYGLGLDGGWYFESDDGIHWSDPVKGYYGGSHYWNEPGHVETPLVLRAASGAADYLFVNRDTAERATGFVFKIKQKAEMICPLLRALLRSGASPARGSTAC